MHRVLAIALSLVVVACSAEAAPDTTESTTTTTTTTTVPTTTTTVPTTTTTIYEMDVAGADPELSELMTRLYSGEAEPDSLAAPVRVVKAFAGSDTDRPLSATATTAEWDEKTRLAVVKTKKDVTLAVADPDWRIIGGWWPSVKGGQHLGKFPKVIAVAGSDARPGENRETARADSIHFLGLDGKGNAGIVGVPRDSWVPIPGAGNSKINASLAFGGPDMMVNTFSELTGFEFDGYLVTGFEGFEGLIEVLGGLAMDVPRNFDDQAAKAYIDAGEQVLDAAQALALSRTRKTLPRGDFQRQEHGGLVMMAAQAMVRANGPSSLPKTLAAARPHFSTSFTPGQLLLLSAAITRIDPDNIVNVVAPGGTGTAGRASVVFLRDSADALWEDLADGNLEQPGE